ncbi:SDR family NAD(P)-dependent oxidoreductase [Chitinophaga sp. 22321]|uniref:SDR family NAD(P)-dependent oxidoreductase n=1 Tax=Chitinophaga hostae TaxID=2831022 RepID=A0ABS5IZN3_9BACT|nr:SDR family NAD(P)-dependent oxidoreductase [Chitinophaga hostae]MBS0028444.1 SDR family NAD(P)-dependent oxidoreductase [Chitinophaga hostae]
MQKSYPKKPVRPPQKQPVQPGLEEAMEPSPVFEKTNTKKGKLHNRTALITGGDSGIGRAVAVAFAREGADVAIAYFNEHTDAETTCGHITLAGRQCLLIAGDIGSENHPNGGEIVNG